MNMICHSLSEFVIIFVVTSCGMQYASVCSNSGVRINHAPATPAASVAPTLHKGKAVGKMRNCGMRNAEGKIRNGMCGIFLRNGG